MSVAISVSDLSFDLILISKEFVGVFDISVFKEFEDLSRGDFLTVDTKERDDEGQEFLREVARGTASLITKSIILTDA